MVLFVRPDVVQVHLQNDIEEDERDGIAWVEVGKRRRRSVRRRRRRRGSCRRGIDDEVERIAGKGCAVLARQVAGCDE